MINLQLITTIKKCFGKVVSKHLQKIGIILYSVNAKYNQEKQYIIFFLQKFKLKIKKISELRFKSMFLYSIAFILETIKAIKKPKTPINAKENRRPKTSAM